ncbi:MAG: sugar ABC transporter permease [Oscillospiraceae bacterium]|nr:sugar ABC transporter permease [Oscillospiraceae bacterium]
MSKSTPQTLDPQAKKAIKFTFMGRKFNTVEAIFGLCLMIPTVAFLAFTFVIPVVQVIQLSFTNFNMATGEMKQIGLSNYTYLLKNDRFWLSMWNTCKYSFLKLTLDTALALLIAVMLDQNIPLRSFLRSTYFAPVVVPMVASSLIWIWFYDPAVGPFNQILEWLGLEKLKWLYHEDTSMLSILFFSIWKGVGYNVILFLSGLQNISDSYLEAARLDGASEWQCFWKIKFPLLRPITSFVIMMGIINSFKVFTEINVMTPDGGPLGSTLLIVNYIYEQAFTHARMGRASAASLLLFIVIFVLTQIQSHIDSSKTIDTE